MFKPFYMSEFKDRRVRNAYLMSVLHVVLFLI